MNPEWGPDPDHAILPDASKYEIIGLHLDKEPLDGGEPFLELVLKLGARRRVLRFWSPQDLVIERGGPVMTHALRILDISARGLEGLGVRVDDFEAGSGTVRFAARAVEEIA